MANQSNSAPTEGATGLDLFAAAWLDRFNSYGGCVMVRTGKNVALQYPFPERRADSEWQDGERHGAIRELIEIVRLVPGGEAALAAHVARFPSYAGKGVVGA